MNRVFLLVFLVISIVIECQAFFVSSADTSKSQDFDESCDGCAEALNALLKNVTFDIGNIDIPRTDIPKVLVPTQFGASVTDITLSNFHIGEIDVQISSDHAAVTPKLLGATLDFKANYDFRLYIYDPIMTKTDHYHFKGSFHGNLADSSIFSELDFTFNSDSVPNAVSAPEGKCQANINIGDFEFDDKINFKGFLDRIVSLVKDGVSKKISSLVCDASKGLPSIVTKDINPLFTNLEPAIEKYLHVNPTIDIPPDVGPGMVKWSDYESQLKFAKNLIASDASNGRRVVDNAVDLLTNGTGEFLLENQDFKINLGDTIFTYTNLTISTIKISGLDTFSDFQILEPVNIEGYPGNHSLGFDIVLGELDFFLAGFVDLAPSSIISKGIGNLREYVNATTKLDGIHFHMILQVALSEEEFIATKFGQFVDNPTGSLLCLIKETNATLVNVTIDSYQVPEIQGFSGLAPLFNELIGVLDLLYGKIAPDALRGAFSIIFKESLNNLVNKGLQAVSADPDKYCPPWNASTSSELSTYNNTSEYINFTLDAILKDVDQIISAVGVDSPLHFSVNWIIDLITNYTGGFIVEKRFFNFDTGAGKDYGINSVQLNLSDLRVQDLDTIYLLDLINPSGDYQLSNLFGIGDRPMSASAEFDLVIQGDAVNNGKGLSNKFILSVATTNLSMDIDLGVKLYKAETENMTVGTFFDFGHLCPFSTLNSTSLDTILLNMSRLQLGLQCLDCSSSMLEKWSHILQEPDTATKLTNQVNSILSTYLEDSSSLRTSINSYLMNLALDAPGYCRNQTKPQIIPAITITHSSTTGGNPTVGLIICISGGILTLLAAALITRYVFSKNGYSKVPSENGSSSMASPKYSDYMTDMFSVSQENTENRSLFNAHKTPFIMRYLIPFLLVANMIIFITAHTNVGASINVIAQVAGDDVQLLSVFEFSLGDSIKQMYQAGVYPLAFLILIFSGVWPYVKSTLLLFCWFIPERHVLPHKRAIVLHWLDVLGKWSLIDCFVLVLLSVAFRFHITSGDIYLLPDDFLVLDIIVLPGWGIHGFILAAVIQLFCTHYLIYLHRSIEQADNGGEERRKHHDLKKRSFLCFSRFKCIRTSDEDEGLMAAIISPIGAFLVLALCVATGVFLILGSRTDTFKFEFKGLAGWALGDNASTFYSLNSLAQTTLDTSNSVGVQFLWFTFMTFALWIPLLQTATLITVWVVPVSRKVQEGLLFAVEVMSAWSSLDVFVVSIVAALYELKQFVLFVIGDNCDLINSVLNSFADGQFGGENTCFDVKAALVSDCWVIITAAVLLMISTNLVLWLVGTPVRHGLPYGFLDTNDCYVRVMKNLKILSLKEYAPLLSGKNLRESLGYGAVEPYAPEDSFSKK